MQPFEDPLREQLIRDAGALNFNKDYLKPLLANPAYSSTQITVTKLGKILTGQATPPQDFDMFCSELVFHLLQLANCTEADIRAAGDTAACASEDAAPFKPMKLVDPEYAGLADGPLLNLMAGRPEAAATQTLLGSVFTEGTAPLSSGHRAVAQQVAPLMSGVQQYYGARIALILIWVGFMAIFRGITEIVMAFELHHAKKSLAAAA